MTDYRIFTSPEFRFKEDTRDTAPFPPWYYETEKKMQEKIARMTQPPQRKDV